LSQPCSGARLFEQHSGSIGLKTTAESHLICVESYLMRHHLNEIHNWNRMRMGEDAIIHAEVLALRGRNQR
jgi:hypothetical protein